MAMTNMTTHRTPQGWTILKITKPDGVSFKIFATWRWDGEKWMLSSGSVGASELTQEENEYVWPQSSGSIYHLPIGGEGCCTSYQGHVLDNIIAQGAAEGIQIEIVKLEALLSRERLLAKIFNHSRWCSASDLSDLAGVPKEELVLNLNDWKSAGKIFSLQRHGEDVFPLYSFDKNFKPLPVMADVLKIFGGEKSEINISAWFASVNSWLRDEYPAGVIVTEPQSIIRAAEIEINPIQHG